MARRDVRLTFGTVSNVFLWLVYAWLVLDVVLLFVAFLLRLLGANPDAGFVDWVYRSIERAMAPFRGIFEPITLTDQSVLDTSLLFAMIVYGAVALTLRAAIDWLTEHLERRRRRLEYEEWSTPPEPSMPAVQPSTSGEGRFAGPPVVVPAQPAAGTEPGHRRPGT